MFDKSPYCSSLANPKEYQTFFDAHFDSIRSDLVDVGNLYLSIAFKVYEIDCRIRRDGKKCKYKNIVEACEQELCFKKSTTYNMLNIVKTYGLDSEGKVSYQQLMTYNTYSYSQLVEMLSLGTFERAEVSPDTSVKEIREIKKTVKTETEIFQTSGKEVEAEIVENSSGQLYVIPPSGTVSEELLRFELHDCVGSVVRENGELLCSFNDEFLSLVDWFYEFFSDLCDCLDPFPGQCSHYLKSLDVDFINLDEFQDKINSFIIVLGNVLDAFKKF